MEVVILTKSAMRKNGVRGACAAAYDSKQNRLVRLTCSADGAPLPYEVADRFSLLDCVHVGVKKACPTPPQTENLWIRTFSILKLHRSEDGVEQIWQRLQTAPSGRRFMDFRQPRFEDVAMFDHSLELVPVPGPAE